MVQHFTRQNALQYFQGYFELVYEDAREEIIHNPDQRFDADLAWPHESDFPVIHQLF